MLNDFGQHGEVAICMRRTRQLGCISGHGRAVGREQKVGMGVVLYTGPMPWALRSSPKVLWSAQLCATSSSGADLNRPIGLLLLDYQGKGKCFPLPHSSVGAALNLHWIQCRPTGCLF